MFPRQRWPYPTIESAVQSILFINLIMSVKIVVNRIAAEGERLSGRSDG